MRVSFPRRFKGFTLIELMVTVAIVAILAAIAYPLFTSFLQRGRRADAVAALSAIVQAQERFRSNRSTYASDLSDLGITTSKISDYYDLEISSLDAGDYASGYQVTATVKETGSQKNDTDCWTLSTRLEEGNVRYLATDKTLKDTSSQCWPR